MKKSIEHKIRFKVAIIYIIVALGIVAMTAYLYTLRKDILSQQQQIEKQYVLLSFTNDLMYAVNEAQSFSGYREAAGRVEKLIDTIIILKPGDAEKLHRIASLLQEHARNITVLRQRLAEKNPVTEINDRLQEYEPVLKKDTVIVRVRQDTVINQAPRKKFFRRLGDVFKPKKDSVKVVVRQQIDTIQTAGNDSLAIIYEVGDIAREAGRSYERNIKSIGEQVAGLINADKNISAELSTLLLAFHKEALDATLSVVTASERTVSRNYMFSIVGGVIALVLILFFIWMIITDINKGREARYALEKANRRTRQIMESRHQLLLSVSHDIKSPLNSILGYLELMEPAGKVRSMQNSGRHILSMLENLLEFSSLEQGTLQNSFSDFDMYELCSEIHEMFLPLADKKGLHCSFEADRVRIHTDQIKLKQIIINLVSNAIKYTKTGGVELNAVYRGDRVIVKVKDTGAGIPAEKQSRLFKPFSRIEENNDLAGGTGLGMYVVKGLVDLLDGEIHIASEVDRGTEVVVCFPTKRALREIPKGAKRIKVYDDDPVMLRMLSDMLLRLGHTITEGECDLILTDMDMGESSGLDVLNAAERVPVIVITGRSDFSVEKALSMGFDGFLAKPFTMDSLREMVGEGAGFEDLMGDDRDEILALFRETTLENGKILAQSVAENDFKRAQAICHKMLPMFAQMGYDTVELVRMDAHRQGAYEGWQEDVERILTITI